MNSPQVRHVAQDMRCSASDRGRTFEDRSLRENIGAAQTRRMLIVAFNLGRTV